MTTLTLSNKQKTIIEGLPAVGDYSNLFFYTNKSELDVEFIDILDRLIGLNDTILSSWLHITPKTFRNYKNKLNLILKDNIKEHIIHILSLYKHGIEVFENVENFEKWLSSENVLLDNKLPSHFLETISGITFINDRLTAMEFGENV